MHFELHSFADSRSGMGPPPLQTAVSSGWGRTESSAFPGPFGTDTTRRRAGKLPQQLERTLSGFPSPAGLCRHTDLANPAGARPAWCTLRPPKGHRWKEEGSLSTPGSSRNRKTRSPSGAPGAACWHAGSRCRSGSPLLGANLLRGDTCTVYYAAPHTSRATEPRRETSVKP